MQILTLQHEDGAAGHRGLRRPRRSGMVGSLGDDTLPGDTETPATSGARSVSKPSVNLPVR